MTYMYTFPLFLCFAFILKYLIKQIIKLFNKIKSPVTILFLKFPKINHQSLFSKSINADVFKILGKFASAVVYPNPLGSSTSQFH